MDGISRYILRQLAVGMVLVTLALTCVIWLSQSLRFIEMIVNRGLSAGRFLYLTVLLMPNFLSIILPIAAFTVVAFVYTKLSSDREIIVMRSAGLSNVTLSKPALYLALIVVLVAYALNLYFLPVSYRMFRELQWDIRYNYSHILLQEGAFNTLSSGVTVYVRERTSGGELKSILVHDTRDADKPTTLMATRGTLSKVDEQPRVIMFDGNRQQVDKTTNKLSILYFDRYAFDLEAPPREVLVRYREPRERMFEELFRLEDDPLIPSKDRGKFVIERHKRLTSPLAALAYALIALAALLTGSYERRGQARHVFSATTVVIGLQIASFGIENVAARNLALVPLIYVVALLPIAIAGYLLVRTPPRQRAKADWAHTST